MLRKLNAEKAMQSLGVLLRESKTLSMGKMRLLKLLYIAERETIKETGRPLLGSRLVAMDHGPLHSTVLDMINGQHQSEQRFSEVFFRLGYLVQLENDPGVSELSRYEIAKLQEVAQRYAHLDDSPLAHEVTHEFQEWKKAHVQGTSRLISLGDVARAVGRADDIQAIQQDEQDRAAFDQIFSEQH